SRRRKRPDRCKRSPPRALDARRAAPPTRTPPRARRRRAATRGARTSSRQPERAVERRTPVALVEDAGPPAGAAEPRVKRRFPRLRRPAIAAPRSRPDVQCAHGAALRVADADGAAKREI